MVLRTATLLLPLPACSALPAVQEPATPEITLERCMADPEWIAREPRSPYWSDDGQAVYFTQRRLGEELSDLWRIDLSDGVPRVVPDDERALADVSDGDVDPVLGRKLYTNHGDLFLRGEDGQVRQLTRTSARESDAAFLLDPDRIRYTRGGTLLIRELSTGLEVQPFELVFGDDPELEADPEPGYREAQQERLFDVIRERGEDEERREARTRELAELDPTRVPRPWYLGKSLRKRGLEALSADERWLLLRVTSQREEGGKGDAMPEFVTESGDVSTRNVRSHVGRERVAEELVLLDLTTRERFDLDLSVLPGIADDPLEFLAEGEPEPEADDAQDEPAADPKPRGVSFWSLSWNHEGTRVAFLARSLDNKDRWLAEIDLETKTVKPIHHLRDEAWINGRFSSWGWTRDGAWLWYLSEETGYSHLYARDVRTGATRALTSGDFEVDLVRLAPDDEHLYFRANADHPGVHEVWRVRLSGGEPEQLTELGGRIAYELSPDGDELLLTHSKVLDPPELYLQDARPGARATRLTTTVTEEFRSYDWVEPELVEIPSRTGRSIHARLYEPEPTSSARPAVLFVHGAGYLQNAHAGWSSYEREFLFHSFLARQGYVVLDVDYRASAGYGRDWRTAIYRRMGTPELEDYEDCIAWLAENHAVDAQRIGIYGGSYGGFLTLMGLFTRPELFACGAALRPVTDWAHYNDGYTRNILNTPELDPAAFEASSPIEFADGLTKPLLICHGMVDDNVLVKDSIRLAQRLIELEKEDWELALYPVEGHGFRRASSWLDEYRRIFKLFESWLRE